MANTKCKFISNVVLIGALTALIAGCSSRNKEVASPPLINGNWVASDNVYTANFNNGRFVATANDTGKMISSGNYVLVSQNRVQIKWFGQVSGKSNTANCTKNGNNLNCVDINGKAFTLIRQGSS